MSDDLVRRLERASDRLDAATETVDAIGEEELRRLREAYDELTTTLDRYEDEATGSGDFEAFIEFQGKVGSFTEDLPEGLRHREVFERVDDHLQQRRLTESDYETAREMLAPIEDDIDRLAERESARDAYTDARVAVERRRETVAEEIETRERLLELGEADLDAPVDRLRDPIAAYDETVVEAFERFTREASAREVLSLVVDSRAFPLASLPDPPDVLLAFVREHEAGTEPIPTLLEYSEFSRSKLAHYVEDPDALQRAVGRRQTYLRRLDADPLTVGWPPPERSLLRWRCRELVHVVGRFAPEAVCERLHAVRALTREDDYQRLRDAAVARDELTDDQLRKLRDGTVEAELADLRAERARLDDALDAYPPL